MDKAIKLESKNLTIRCCNEITIGYKHNYENNVLTLKNVVCDIYDNKIVILNDLNPTLKIESDIVIPMSNIASYWIN